MATGDFINVEDIDDYLEPLAATLSPIFKKFFAEIMGLNEDLVRQ